MNANVRDICKPGHGQATCRFLTMGPAGWSCAKRVPSLKAMIDIKAASGTMNALGDNCPGKLDEELNEP